jgi:hypothetical protein
MATPLEIAAYLHFAQIEHAINRLMYGIAERVRGGRIPDDLTLYHYTTRAGLEGILRSHRLRAFNIEQQTDYTEVRLFTSLLRAALDYRHGYVENDDEASFYASLRYRMKSVRAHDVFVLSFSDNGQHERMWRLYGERQKGFSFCILAKDAMSFPDIMLFTKCVYDQGLQRMIIEELLDFSLHSYRGIPATIRPLILNKFVDLFIRASSWLSPTFKLQDYSEEREWRAVILRSEGHIEIAESGRRYIEVISRDRRTLPILAMYAGPNCDTERTASPMQKVAIETGYEKSLFHRSDGTVLG